MSKTYTIDVQERDDGELFIELPQEVLNEAGWKIGDRIKWTESNNGSFTLTKADTEWVLVECVSTFRQRYMVEVPRGRDAWALDTVVMQEAKEFSQKHLDETIVSHRVVPYDEAIKLCRADNDYTGNWSDEKVEETFFTPHEE